MTTAVAGAQRLLPGDHIRLPVFVRDAVSGEPISGAEVLAWADVAPLTQPNSFGVDYGAAMPPGAQVLGRARSDPFGVAILEVTAPSQGNAGILVDTRRGLDSDRIDAVWVLRPEVWPVVSTDRPRYQPGDPVRIRALLLDETRRPVANANVQIQVSSRSNGSSAPVLLKATAVTSSFGAAAVEVSLPKGAPAGSYWVDANGSVAAVFDVTNSGPPLLRADIAVASVEPGQPLHGVITVRERSGRPVVGARVRVFAAKYLGGPAALQSLSPTAEATTNEQGTIPYSVRWERWQNWSITCALAAIVEAPRLGAQRVETRIDLRRAPRVHSVAEQDKLVPGVENVVFVQVTDRQGRGFSGTVEVVGHKTRRDQDDSSGVFGVTARPASRDTAWEATVLTTDGADRSASERIHHRVDGPESTLIRPNQSVYRVGEQLELTLLSPTPGRVYVSLQRLSRVLESAEADLRDGVAHLSFPVSDKLVGPVSIYAYRDRLSRDDEPPPQRRPLGRRWVQVENLRRIHVDSDGELLLRLDTDRRVYAPGDVAKVRVHVERPGGGPVAAGVFMAAVDGSVAARYRILPGDDQTRLADSTRFCNPDRPESPEILLRPRKAGRGDLQAAYLLAGGRAGNQARTGASLWQRRQFHLATLLRRLTLISLVCLLWTVLLSVVAITNRARGRARRGAGAVGIALAAVSAVAAWACRGAVSASLHEQEPRAPGSSRDRLPVQPDEDGGVAVCASVSDDGYFPPPIAWIPESVTDARGRGVVDIPIPEAFGAHVFTATAITVDGRMATGRLTLEIRSADTTAGPKAEADAAAVDGAEGPREPAAGRARRGGAPE
jgi:hypothetical protein